MISNAVMAKSLTIYAGKLSRFIHNIICIPGYSFPIKVAAGNGKSE